MEVINVGSTRKDWQRTELDKPANQVDAEAVANGPRRVPALADIEKQITRGAHRHALIMSDEREKFITPLDKSVHEFRAQRAVIFLKLRNLDEAEHNWGLVSNPDHSVEARYLTELFELFLHWKWFNKARDVLMQIDQLDHTSKVWLWIKWSEIAVEEIKGSWLSRSDRKLHLEVARERLEKAWREWEDKGGDDADQLKQLVWQQFLIDLYEPGGAKSRETTEQIELLFTLSKPLGKKARLHRLKYRMMS